jgi:hypothetical protein
VRRVLEPTALLVVLALVWAGVAQARAESRFWGVVDASTHLSEHEFGKMDRGGVGSLRYSLFWFQVEATKGTFNWTLPDQAIGDAASRGLQVLPAIYGTPHYAGKTPATPPLRSGDTRNEWRDFLQRVVQRYGPGGDYWTDPSLYPTQHPGASPMPIHYWQIWNEPNIPAGFQPRPSAKRYAKLLRISHDAILGQSPNAKIVLAGMPGLSDIRGWRFLSRIYGIKGMKRYFDVVAIHPYSLDLHGFAESVRRMRNAMRRHHDRRTPLWITEIGWGSAHRDGSLNVGLQGQKKMLKGAFRLASHNRKQWHLGRLFWFEWRDPRAYTGECPWCGHAGLFRHNRKPKPAWQAYKQFAR